MDIIFYDLPINHNVTLMPHPAIGFDGSPSFDLPASFGLSFNDFENNRAIECNNYRGLDMMCNDKNFLYSNVSPQKIEIDNDKHVVNMKLKVADKDSFAIKRSAKTCGFKVK